jgi:triosephosphate isomerase
MKTRKLIVGNWKMNPQTPSAARAIFSAIKRQVARLKNVSVVICPPDLFLSDLAEKARGVNKISVGAQDAFFESVGAFTGEVSPLMLKNAGANYVILGHSERRSLGETDVLVNKKVLASIKVGLSAIVCVGERERDKDITYLEFIKNQIKTALLRVNRPSLGQIVIAYEPVWAIGKSANDAITPRDLREMNIFIKRVLADMYGKENIIGIPVLYGGSVTAENAAGLIEDGAVDGLLVGRESRDPESFGKILKIIDVTR